MVGKIRQLFLFLFPHVFPFCFLIFLFFPRKWFTVSLDAKRSRSGRDFSIPFSTLLACISMPLAAFTLQTRREDTEKLETRREDTEKLGDSTRLFYFIF